MFVNLDVLAQDLPQFNPVTYIRSIGSNKTISYVIPVGRLELDDFSALYATTCSGLPECSKRAEKGINILCVGVPDKETVYECDNVNLLVFDADPDEFEGALHECAKVIAWYADGFSGLAEAVESGDKDAVRRATALLRYCLSAQESREGESNAFVDQIESAINRDVTSWQLFEETLAEGNWRLDNEYFCMVTVMPSKPLTQFFARQHIGMDNGPIYVCMIQEDRMITVVNTTRMGLTYQAAAKAITTQLFELAGSAVVGISNPFNNLQDIHCYVRQAQDALTLNAKLGRAQGASRFSDRFLDFVAVQCLKAFPPSALYPPGYELLRSQHSKCRKEESLLLFLDAYVKNDFQMKSTIAESYYSRTTAFEKLRKIKQLTGMDFNDPNTRVALQIATRATEVSKRSPSLGGLSMGPSEGGAEG